MAAVTDFPTSDINRMILDYLTSMAHTKAALSFCKEAKLDLQQSQEFVECRASIMMLILEGIVMKAISLLNEWDPEVSYYKIFFLLL